jgi:sensor domain CHASE-containing protein
MQLLAAKHLKIQETEKIRCNVQKKIIIIRDELDSDFLSCAHDPYK